MRVRNDDEQQKITIAINLDSKLARGFAISIAIHLLLFILGWFLFPPRSGPVPEKLSSHAVEILRFGLGDGAGPSGGNLTAEGKARKGAEAVNPLEDAQSAKGGKSKESAAKNPAGKYHGGEKIVLTPKDKSSEQGKKDKEGSGSKATGEGSKNVGAKNGTDDGTGLGHEGTGAGKGLGYGIDWGNGGGNRIVTTKVLPRYPEGVNREAQIKVRFVVQPDGTVGKMTPLQKGDNRLEQAALAALRAWRFNPLKDDKEMVGTITFYFKLE